jgi:hypothetical protein
MFIVNPSIKGMSRVLICTYRRHLGGSCAGWKPALRLKLKHEDSNARESSAVGSGESA